MMSVVPNDPEQDQESVVETELAEAADAAIRLLGDERALHQRLVQEGPGGEAEKSLLECIKRRRSLEERLGKALMKWFILGGSIALEIGEDDVPSTEDPDVELEIEPEPPAPEPEPEPEPQTPKPPANPASLDQLRQLVNNGLQPNWTDKREIKVRLLRRLFRTIGKPGRLRTKGAVQRTVRSLCVAAGRADDWLDLPRPAQKQILGLISSIARHIQDECKQPMDPETASDHRTLFSSMTRWSGEHRPGYVTGLSRHNDPEFGKTWLDEAKHWWGELQEELNGTSPPETSPKEALSELEYDLSQPGIDKAMVQRSVQAALDAGVSQSEPRLLRLLTPHSKMLKGARGMKTLKTVTRKLTKANYRARLLRGRPPV